MHRKLPSWHQIQHCTGAPRPNGRPSKKYRALRGRHFLIQGVDHRQGENSFLHSLFHMLCAKLHTLSPATAAPLPLRGDLTSYGQNCSTPRVQTLRNCLDLNAGDFPEHAFFVTTPWIKKCRSALHERTNHRGGPPPVPHDMGPRRCRGGSIARKRRLQAA